MFVLALAAGLTLIMWPVRALETGTRLLERAIAAPEQTEYAAEATAALEYARSLRPDDPLTLRRLARSYLIVQRPEDAITALEQAYRLEPRSLLIGQELASAQVAAGRLTTAAATLGRLGVDADGVASLLDAAIAGGDTAAAERWMALLAVMDPARSMAAEREQLTMLRVDAYLAHGKLDQAAALLSASGVDAATAEARGNSALAEGQAALASRWLASALALDRQLAPALAFRRAAAALIGGEADAALRLAELRAAQPDFPVYAVTRATTTRIPADELRWLIDQRQWGVFFGERAGHNAPPGTGVLWWNGRAMAVIDVREAGRYRLRLRAQHDTPPPIAISMTLGERRIYNAALGRGDGSWGTLDVIVDLKQGPQALVVVFGNNAVVDGDDRDARLASLSLTALAP